MKKRVADIVMEILLENGIDTCFSVVGGGAMHLNNAMALSKDLKKVFNHHEQACTMAAEAYARLTGKVASVVVTSGPGGTNAITGVMGAWQDSLPMVVISGQVRYETSVESTGLPLRYRGVQEFDIINSVGNMTKYAKLIIDPLSIKQELQKAINISMSGRRGPVWLDIPLNVQSAIVEELDLYPVEVQPESYEPAASMDEIKFIFDKLKQAKRPCILAGNGIRNSGTTELFRQFAYETGIPVIGAAITPDVLYSDNSRYYGMAGTIGPRTGNFIVQNADVILSLGSSLGYKVTGFAQDQFAPNAYVISVDIDDNEVKKPGVRVDTFVHSDLKDFFDKSKNILEMIDIDSTWIEYCDKLKSRFSLFEKTDEVNPNERISSYYFWEKYQEHEPKDNISVLGNNTANSAKLQIGVKSSEQRLLSNINCGSMGYDLPATVGAAVASNKRVVCLTGDGSVMMNIQELQTIAHYKLPVKVVIFSNDGYGAIRQTCKNFFEGVYIGCTEASGVSFPNFEKIAEAFGGAYKACKSNAEIDEALDWLFADNEFALLEVSQKYDDPISPKVMSRLKEDGTFETPALHDMAPFLSKEDMSDLMLW